MRDSGCEYCKEVKKSIRDYFIDPETSRLFCDTGCRDMWYTENGTENLETRMLEKGVILIRRNRPNRD